MGKNKNPERANKPKISPFWPERNLILLDFSNSLVYHVTSGFLHRNLNVTEDVNNE